MIKLDPKLCLIFLGFALFCYERIHFTESLKLDAKDQNDNEMKYYSNKGDSCIDGEILESGVCTVAGYRSDLMPDQNLNINVLLTHQSIHGINDNRNTFTMNMNMKMYWRDPVLWQGLMAWKNNEATSHSPQRQSPKSGLPRYLFSI